MVNYKNKMQLYWERILNTFGKGYTNDKGERIQWTYPQLESFM
jgi:hypothetical protein